MADRRTFDSTIQDVVYSLDVGFGLKVMRISLYVLMLLVVVLVYTATQFRGLNSEEAMDYAQLGRNFSLRNGMITKNISPMTMTKMKAVAPEKRLPIEMQPDLIHAPAYPALLSAGYKLFELLGTQPLNINAVEGRRTMPAEQWIILPINHIFTMLTGWLVFSLGKHLFYREIGFLSMTIFFLSDIAWQTSISGLNLSMAIFFSVAAFRFIVVAFKHQLENRRKIAFWATFLFSVLLAVLAFYTRFITIMIVPGLCLYAFLMAGRSRGGTRYALAFGLLFALLIMPWLMRNHQLCGNPAGHTLHTALAGSPQFPGNALFRNNYENGIPGETILDALKQKWILNFSGRHHAVIPSLGGGVLMAFFIITFFYRFIRPPMNHLRNSVGLSLMLVVITAGFFSESSVRMINTFWPFVILFGVAFFYILLDRLDLRARLYVVVMKCFLVALACIPLVLKLMPPHINYPYPPYHAPVIARVSEMLTPREVMCTDMPWATSWYGDRVSILLPGNVDQFYDINDYQQRISGIFLTTITKNKPFLNQLLDGPDQTWLPIMSGRIPPDFPLRKAFLINRQDNIFISDRARWLEAEETPVVGAP